MCSGTLLLSPGLSRLLDGRPVAVTTVVAVVPPPRRLISPQFCVLTILVRTEGSCVNVKRTCWKIKPFIIFPFFAATVWKHSKTSPLKQTRVQLFSFAPLVWNCVQPHPAPVGERLQGSGSTVLNRTGVNAAKVTGRRGPRYEKRRDQLMRMFKATVRKSNYFSAARQGSGSGKQQNEKWKKKKIKDIRLIFFLFVCFKTFNTGKQFSVFFFHKRGNTRRVLYHFTHTAAALGVSFSLTSSIMYGYARDRNQCILSGFKESSRTWRSACLLKNSARLRKWNVRERKFGGCNESLKASNVREDMKQMARLSSCRLSIKSGKLIIK